MIQTMLKCNLGWDAIFVKKIFAVTWRGWLNVHSAPVKHAPLMVTYGISKVKVKLYFK
jgi:hypothetical protein